MPDKHESYTSTEMEEVINHFVEYVNRWWRYHDAKGAFEEDPYSYESYTVYDPSRDLYGRVLSTKELKVETGPYTSKVLIMQVTDGDEGGPNDLIAGYQGDYGVGIEGEELSWIMQVFDTLPALIWTREDGYRSPPNGEMKP